MNNDNVNAGTIHRRLNKKSGRAERGSRRGMFALSALVFSMLPVHQSFAELPDTSVFANAMEVSDEFLAESRGKFISSGQIMNFGVRMVTEWVTSTGEVINATGNLAINMSSGQPVANFQPSITVQQVQPNVVSTSLSNNTVSGSKGLENVTGVVQNIQVAGHTNGIANSIGVSVKQYTGTGSSGGSSGSNLNVLTPGGNNASVTLANNGLSVAVQVANQGQARQAIRSVSQGNGQVMQSVQLGGNLNQIRNLINLDIQTRHNSPSHSLNTMQVLSSLRQINNSIPF